MEKQKPEKANKKKVESLAEQFMQLQTGGKSMAALLISAYAEGRAAGAEQERKRWEQKTA